MALELSRKRSELFSEYGSYKGSLFSPESILALSRRFFQSAQLSCQP